MSKKKIQEELSDVIAETNAKPVDLKKTSKEFVEIPDSALINVKSNVFGELIYVDPITHEKYSWMRCGEVLTMPMSALRHMKTGASVFYSNQHIIILGFADKYAEQYLPADIYKALYITQYYKEIIDPSDYEELCSWSPEEIEQKVSLMSDSTKKKLIVALNTYIEKGVLDSIKTARAFEKALGAELHEL